MKRHRPTVRKPDFPLESLLQEEHDVHSRAQQYDDQLNPKILMNSRNRSQKPTSRIRDPHHDSRQGTNNPSARPVRSVAANGVRRPEASMRADPNSRPRRRKSMKLWKKILIGALIVVLGVSLTAGTMAYFEAQHLLNQIQIIPDDTNPTIINDESSVVYLSDVVTETTKEPIPTFEGIHNILLIGIDSRSKGYSEDGSGNLADIIMILTINENDSSLKLTSIQRDSLVYVPGHTDPMKINAAMNYGGPQLLRTVIEQHLRIDLEEYAYVNFRHMEKIIDAVGGVVVNVSESERTNPEGGLNELIAEQNDIFGSPVDENKVYQTGDLRLNGRQAVAYARIRHVGNGDYDRSKRQVEVLQALLDSFMQMSFVGKTDVLADILGEICTNIPKEKIEQYAFTLLPMLTSTDLTYLQVPIEGYSNEQMYYDFREKGEWSIRANWNGMIPLIQQFIFGETFAFDPVPVIPEAPVTTPTPVPSDEPDPAG